VGNGNRVDDIRMAGEEEADRMMVVADLVAAEVSVETVGGGCEMEGGGGRRIEQWFELCFGEWE
jgi:hypothetical protein